VTSKASSDFWSTFAALPSTVQRQARKQYALFKTNPQHPSLQFKELAEGLASVRVTRRYRALGWREGDVILWFWIGSHADYDKLISR
jgi:hypothetical protein